ncbi:MAG: hypothetical protein IJ250_04110 [Bacteroidales bacterium]|nr:hypothetical protein [Bacteroidales bacterium]
MKKVKIKAALFSAVAAICAVVFLACDDEYWDNCGQCSTPTVQKHVWLKNTDPQNPESTVLFSVQLVKDGENYVVNIEESGCWSRNTYKYPVCNPSAVKKLFSDGDTLTADIYCNLHEGGGETEFTAEILKVFPLKANMPM